METTVARGIHLLGRGQDLRSFIFDFLTDRGIVQFSLHQRGDGIATSPIMYLNQQPRMVVTFWFHEAPIDELGYHAKDLSPKERERDLKPLVRYL